MTAPAAYLFNEHQAPTAAGCLVVGDLMRQMRPSGIDPTRVPSLLRNAPKLLAVQPFTTVSTGLEHDLYGISVYQYYWQVRGGYWKHMEF
jgi:hypothetical protein